TMMEALAGAGVVLVIPGPVAGTLRRLLNPPESGGIAQAPAIEAPVARLRGYSMAMREISRAFDQAYVLPREESDRMPRMFGAIASRVCERCRDYRRCWETEFRNTYRAMFDLIRRAEEAGSLPVDGPDTAGTLRCRFPDRIALSVNHLVEIEKTAKRWQRRVAEGRGILEGQMRMASRLMDEIASELTGGGQPARAAEPRTLSYSVGIAQANKDGVEISGDSARVRDLKDNRLLVALSDGMGAGASAAEESKAAVHLIETLMDAGFDREAAVGTVNSVLVARGTGEAFATLDMMHVDLAACDAEFVKIGACPSFIKRDNEVVVIRAQSLPAGILSEIPVETVHRRLMPGDTVVLVTDGVLEARKDPSRKEPWIASFLARSRWMPAQELAEKVLERAQGARGPGEDIKDDMTVIVVQFPGV
ncbi:MAG: SpoIIE family protein phosphatase, partial [Bacillota bacterium]